MPAPVALFLAPTVGGAALLSKKKQARRAHTDNAPTGVTTGDVAENVANGDNLATATKKPTNWLLIGGVVVGAVLLFRMFKK